MTVIMVMEMELRVDLGLEEYYEDEELAVLVAVELIFTFMLW